MSAVQFDLLYRAQTDVLSQGCIVAGVSWGNDSIALVQLLRERGLEDVVCLYNDTGWAMPAHDGEEGWNERVGRMEAWARSIGYQTARTVSIGMEALVHDHRGWPRQGVQFCTEDLKVAPTIAWLAERDPFFRVVCANGKRRAEGLLRSRTPEWIGDSPMHGGRRLWQPIYDQTDQGRDDLIRRAGHEVLRHKSKECKVCVNENRAGLMATPEIAIADIERIERDLGVSPTTGKPKTMFRPAKKMGATGIRQIVRWAKSAPGKFSLDDGTGPSATETGCDGGFCAS